MNNSTINADHVAKQRKRKDLPNTKVYGSQNGIVELHDLGDYEVENKQLKTHIQDLIKENESLNTRVDNAKEALKATLDRVKIIEGKMKTYGIE